MCKLLRRLAYMLQRRRHEDDLDEELLFHEEMKRRELEAQGLDAEAAAQAARRAVGNLPLTRNSVRDVWVWPWLQEACQDLHYGARALRNNSGPTATIVLTLALGLGVNASTLAVAYRTLWKPLPYDAPDRLVLVTLEGRGGEHFGIERAELDDWMTYLGSLTGTAAYYSRELTLRGFGEARAIRVAYVTADFFDVLGVPTEVGRTSGFGQADNLVVMSHWLASQAPGKSVNSVLGTGVTLGERVHTVAGVMPRRFTFPSSRTDAWIRTPRTQARLGNVGAHMLVGRLRDGATLADVRHEANALLEKRHPSGNLSRAVVTSYEEQAFVHVRPAMLSFLAAGALVLIVSCANVVLLLLGRAVGRQQDSGIRVALGCGWNRLLRASVVEGILVATGSLLLGLFLARGTLWMMRNAAAGWARGIDDVVLDRPVLLATLLVGVGVALLYGFVTTSGTSRHPAPATLRGSTASASRKSRLLSSTLVVAQLALSLVLLIGAGLLVRTMLSLVQGESGFEPANVMAVKLVLSDDRLLDAPHASTFARRLTDRVRGLPGVNQVGFASTVPPRQAPPIHIGFQRVSDNRDEFLMVSLGSVTPGYFPALGTRLLGGRFFGDEDEVRDDGVVVLSESAARFFLPEGDPVGRNFPGLPAVAGVGSRPRVVGVVEDIKYSGLDAPRGSTIYVPWSKRPVGTAYLVMRTAGDPLVVAPAVVAAAKDLDPGLPVPDVRTLEREMADSIADRRLRVAPAVGFAGLALVVSMVGLFSAVSRSVSERRHALAIRAASGASPMSLLRLVMRDAMRMTATGVALGLAAATWAAVGLAHLLYGVSPHDALTYVAATLAVVIVSLGASCIPARRVLSIDPVRALRSE